MPTYTLHTLPPRATHTPGIKHQPNVDGHLAEACHGTVAPLELVCVDSPKQPQNNHKNASGNNPVKHKKVKQDIEWVMQHLLQARP